MSETKKTWRIEFQDLGRVVAEGVYAKGPAVAVLRSRVIATPSWGAEAVQSEHFTDEAMANLSSQPSQYRCGEDRLFLGGIIDVVFVQKMSGEQEWTLEEIPGDAIQMRGHSPELPVLKFSLKIPGEHAWAGEMLQRMLDVQQSS